MAIYDMYKNKNVALEDIVKRQCMLGAKNLLQGGKEGSWKKAYADETKEKIKYYYDYIH